MSSPIVSSSIKTNTQVPGMKAEYELKMSIDHGMIPKDLNALQLACLNRKEAEVDDLLKQERVIKTINDRIDSGETIMHFLASRIGTLNIINKLMQAGAKYDIVDHEGMTSLSLAASKGNIDVVKLLLFDDSTRKDKGQIINLSAPLIRPPLYWALKYAASKKDKEEIPENSIELIKVLLDYGANPLKKCYFEFLEENMIVIAQKLNLSAVIVKMLQDKVIEIQKREETLKV